MNMDPFIVLLNVAIPLVMTVQVNFYFNSVFGKEKSKPTKWLYILAFLIANVLFLNVPLPLLGFNLLMMAAIFCLSLGFESELRMRVVFSVLYIVLLTLVHSISVYVLDPSLTDIPKYTYTANEGDQLLFGTRLLLSYILMFAVVQVIRMLAKRRNYPLSLRYHILFLSVPLISTYQVNVLTMYSEKNLHYYLAVIGLIVLNILVVYILDTIMARFQLMHQNAQLQHQMDYQEANYEKTVHSFKKIKSIIHDTNQQLLFIDECMKQGKTAEASEHIRVTLNKVEDAYDRINTGNLAIDALLTNALNIGQANGIKMITELRLFDRELPIERYDLCVVLGNLLDNAIEASKKIKLADDRQMVVNIRSSESALFIRIRNHVEREVNDLQSKKANPEFHGFGLTNIKRICEKYGGHMTIETKANLFENMVVLPFPDTNNSRT